MSLVDLIAKGYNVIINLKYRKFKSETLNLGFKYTLKLYNGYAIISYKNLQLFYFRYFAYSYQFCYKIEFVKGFV